MDLFDKIKILLILKASILQGRRKQCCPEPSESWSLGRAEDGRRAAMEATATARS